MKNKELVEAVTSAIPGVSVAVGSVVTSIFLTIAEEVAKGGVVEIAGFGKFERTTRAARKARNPQTGAMMDVPEKSSMKFKPSKKLAAQIAQPSA